ncbi:hypothetical protein EMIHUDRAFT_437158 [Emiliania huxleyi CCMP1516]|uniref:tRNA-dihydrouridine(16/17) synthase [NAD(P)(+)] n=2 Tax=Emiliania huxleyi TaxID=2903 RepID=A0A0D3IPB4_EMIH1|nr:hypothetical protein EMIHUDRAFT_437158 [Emiliania huxleyi CCMP1516]EOD13099.1 hypothetical protein EMIHUDRAFT_437158 [Emiliania huxleyi CCMP1516]|eukprot:XP_005765528.1 hypothetical protein EMIHUDRAFT_437158 [Emiliania huxleyi CCMP1516]
MVASAWDFWRSIGSPRHVCAPMVDQSEAAFRVLTRSLGVQLAYTPMLHARLMVEAPAYRAHTFDPEPDGVDRPLVAQLAGHDASVLLAAGRLVQSHVDAVDINFGCPQGIARKGRYGAFLLDEPELAVSLVRALAEGLDVPVTAKVRLLPSVDASVALCRRMQEAGASALCVHGRTKEQNKHRSGPADWAAIARIVEALDIPVIANGGIATADDVAECLARTGAAAVMSSEALLENPALFCANVDPDSGAYLDQPELARRYLRVCRQLPPPTLGHVRSHLFKLLHAPLRHQPLLREDLLEATSLDDVEPVVERLAACSHHQPAFHTPRFDAAASWYWRHRTAAVSADGELGETRGAGGASSPESRSRAELEAAALERRDRRRREKKRRRRQRGAASVAAAPAVAVL